MLLIKNYQFNILMAVIIFIFDRILKSAFYIEKNNLTNYTKNLGIAFGIYLPKVFLLIMIFVTLIVLIGLLISNWRQKKYFIFSAYLLIMLGASSNLIDRLQYGFVIDYIDLKIWPIFNLADLSIFIGVLLALYQFYQQSKLKS